ncbi:MAG: hypothetical protein U0271_42805 [Polyangiaceae bacterium]
MRIRTLLPALALLGLGCTDKLEPERDAEPPLVSAPLEAAHEAYLDGDWLALGERIHDVLLDPSADELARENALELLDAAYRDQNGTLPSRFTPPEGVDRLAYGHVRAVGLDGLQYRRFFRGRLKDPARIARVTVEALPERRVVLDSDDPNAELESEVEEPGFSTFSIDSGPMQTAPADGVYAVRIALTTGATSEGWFIARELTSSSVPELVAPEPNITERRPEVRWVRFSSPEFAPFENKTVSVYLMDDAPPWPERWSVWRSDADDVVATTIGAEPDAPATELAPGDYVVSLSLGENRRFGPVRLDRISRAARSFHVVAP